MIDNLSNIIASLIWLTLLVGCISVLLVYTLGLSLSNAKLNEKPSLNVDSTIIATQEDLEWYTAALKKLGFDDIEVNVLLSKKFNYAQNSMDNKPYKELNIISHLIESIAQLQGETIFTQEEQDAYGASVDDVHQMTLNVVRTQIRLFKLRGVNFSGELSDLTGKLERHNSILTQILNIIRGKLKLNEEQNLNSINQRLTSLKTNG